MKHTAMWLDDNNKSALGYRPVHMNTLTDEVEPVPPMARVY
jgi:succinate dehydrogenase / fumarate reductase flavoprotein subunit